MKSKAKNAVLARASSSVGLVDDAIDRLFNQISTLITAARERVAVGVNTELTKLNWNVGNCINRENLGRGRAEYGKQIVKGLASRLMLIHGSGWDEKSLRHCLRAAETFGEDEIVSATRRQLSWTHIKTLSCRRRSDVMTMPQLAAHYNGICHDRFIIVDQKEIFWTGASLKDAGRLTFAAAKMYPPSEASCEAGSMRGARRSSQASSIQSARRRQNDRNTAKARRWYACLVQRLEYDINMRMTKSRNGKAVVKTESAFYAQVRDVFVQARQFVHKTANFAMVKAYWLVGKMIVEKQGGEAKAAYGDRLIDELFVRLTQDLGAGFTRVNLFYMRRFYLAFQNVHTLCEQLSWSHYRLLISVENEEARAYYLEEARKSLWSVRERTQSKTQILSRNWTLARSAA